MDVNQDWVCNTSVGLKGKNCAGGSRPMNPKVAATAEVAKRETEPQALHDIVPPGDEAKPLLCPICKETLKSEFLKDDEDRVQKNTVMKYNSFFYFIQ